MGLQSHKRFDELQPGDHLRLEGRTVEQVITGMVIVRFDDGTERWGPPHSTVIVDD